jgi:hypothetical protein
MEPSPRLPALSIRRTCSRLQSRSCSRAAPRRLGAAWSSLQLRASQMGPALSPPGFLLSIHKAVVRHTAGRLGVTVASGATRTSRHVRFSSAYGAKRTSVGECARHEPRRACPELDPGMAAHWLNRDIDGSGFSRRKTKPPHFAGRGFFPTHGMPANLRHSRA